MNTKNKTKNLAKSRPESVREVVGGSEREHDVRAEKLVTVTRAYHLQCLPNRDKLETARYFINRFNLYVNYCVSREFFNQPIKSTAGCGELFNKALYKARDIVKKQKLSSKETGNKINIPNITKERPLVKFEKAKSSFDYIVKIPNLFEKGKVVKIPVSSHKALNQELNQGWKFTSFGEISEKNGKLYLTVFVQKEVKKAMPQKKCLGIDVGIKKTVTRSDGHKGGNLSIVISKFKESQRERYRQRMKFHQPISKRKTEKTYLKQILDIEAKKAIARCLADNTSISVESRKTLSNLKSGKISLWARNYFANRVEVLSKENSVFMIEVNPYRTSQICSCCGEFGIRDKEQFKCINSSCEQFSLIRDSDFNASLNIAHRGRQVILEKIIPSIKLRSGCRKSES